MDTPPAQKNPPHKHGVVAVLRDEAGQYLVIRRGLTIARAPGFWCFVGGEVEQGETLQAAIEREVREEVGLLVRAFEKIHETIAPQGEFVLHWMRVDLLSPGRELSLHPVEVAEARWLSLRDALRLEPILPGMKAWLQAKLADA
jgi:8-oxo-dGTP pyrophosphatase MutT (NUDIX family)